MALWNLDQINSSLNSSPRSGKSNSSITGLSIDSRTTEKGDIFLCIRGENLDGHRFIAKAVDRGASVIIADEKSVSDATVNPSSWPWSEVSLYVVNDTLEALRNMAAYRRDQMQATVIGVTGSSGKTSTRDILYSMACQLEPGRVEATKGNLNNHIGLPLSIVRMQSDTKLAILEMGMNHAGEIRSLTELARPDSSIITSISGAHMEFFASVDEIAEAKLEIIEGMRPGGQFICNGDIPHVEYAKKKILDYEQNGHFYGFIEDLQHQDRIGVINETADELKAGVDGISFVWRGQTIHNSSLRQKAFAWNLLGAMVVFSSLGYSDSEVAGAACTATILTPRRFDATTVHIQGRDILIVDDSYNANPDSYRRALQGLRDLFPSGRIGLYAGEMAELGNAAASVEHFNIGKQAAFLGYRLLGVCGKKYANDILEGFIRNGGHPGIIQADLSETLLEKLPELIEKERELDGILIKGSRSTRMDLIGDALKSLH